MKPLFYILQRGGLMSVNTYEKGKKFEIIVEKWAKRKYNADFSKRNIRMRGNSKKIPYQIDIHLNCKKFIGENDIWIECKDLGSSIKARNMQLFAKKAEDIENACYNGIEEFCFDKLVYVSTSDFDYDALKVAEEEDIDCFQYTNGRFIQKQ